MHPRIQKTLLGLVIAIYMLLVCFNNLTDYNTNFVFLSKVTAMEDLISKDANSWRSVNTMWLHHVMYWSVIGLELTITLFLWRGVVAMFRSRKMERQVFEASKSHLLTGLTLGVVLWIGMFICIAGEWFLMWQSEKWNAQATAFSLGIVFLLIRLNIAQKED